MSSECGANIPSGYKYTELGVIPEDWDIKPIGEAFEVHNHLRIPISQKVREKIVGKYPYYGPTGVQGYINEYHIEGQYSLIGEDGDHFLKWRSMPMTLIVSGKFNVNNHAHVVKGRNNLTSWFYYYFSHKDLTQHLTRQGAGRYKLTKKTLLNVQCILPPLPEQEAIVNAFSDIDSLIESLEQLIAKKRQIKKGAMQELLTGKRRLPKFNTLPGYKETDVGVIPKDWEITSLVEKANIIDSLHQTPSFVEDGFSMVRVSDIKTGNLDLNRTFKVCETIFAEFTRNYKPKRGDIVLSRVGSYGVTSFVETDEPFCMGQNTVVIESKVPARLLNYILNSSYIRWQIEDKSFGTGYKSLSLKSIKELKIAIPHTIAEQFAIAAILSDMDSEITALEEKLAKARQIKQGMMQELLTGRIRLI